jgi:hypothetical protein
VFELRWTMHGVIVDGGEPPPALLPAITCRSGPLASEAECQSPRWPRGTFRCLR